ncbi:MAG: D-alanyl-D-alanine carboxypeptidase [Parcubacteria bacterium C7867-008]|nr:MAG: D-alanyl-D-alanine carboxypeptidase [Parcubacteria bacterium C7867-008]
MTPARIAIIALCGAVLVGVGTGAYLYYQEHTKLVATQAELASSTERSLSLQKSLVQVTDDRNSLQDAFTSEKQKNDQFDSQIRSLGSTVGKLNKLAQTDPQLLAKYSKVYFLNENYIPSALSPIDSEYLFEPSRNFEIHSEIRNHLEDLLEGAKDDDIDILIASAYRSFGTQAALKASYKITYGAGSANAFSADQGYSEHQLGTALDLTTKSVGGTFSGFEKTEAYAWLNKNAYKYGFILSYPKSNGYYQFEPWHWRFVGIDLATKLHDDGKFFYDLDQREINGYLASLFD